MQNNDPKHTSKRALNSYLKTMGSTGGGRPPKAQMLTQLKICGIFKEYLRREVKPHNKDELVEGIISFWPTVTIDKCRLYINDLRRVIPRIIELKGDPTGF